MLPSVFGIITPNSETIISNVGLLMAIMKQNELIYRAKWLRCCRTLTSSRCFLIYYVNETNLGLGSKISLIGNYCILGLWLELCESQQFQLIT